MLEGAAPGALIIDFSTGDPAVERELAAAAAERGVGFLDAPVSRGVVGAERGTLVVMVGGDAEALEAARPLLGPRLRHRARRRRGRGSGDEALQQHAAAINATGLGEVLVDGGQVPASSWSR